MNIGMILGVVYDGIGVIVASYNTDIDAWNMDFPYCYAHLDYYAVISAFVTRRDIILIERVIAL